MLDGRRTASSRPTSTTRSRRASARSACWSRSKSTGDQDALDRARPADRHARRRRQPARRLAPTRSIRPLVERERAIFTEQAANPASPKRSSRRWSKAACASSTRKSCCSSRSSSSTARRPSARRRGGREGRRRADQGHRLRPLRAGRRHREGRTDFAAEVAAAAGQAS